MCVHVPCNVCFFFCVFLIDRNKQICVVFTAENLLQLLEEIMFKNTQVPTIKKLFDFARKKH